MAASSGSRDPRATQLRRAAGSLFSSDVYQSYTASYTWTSNQTAHLGLGFILASIALAWFPELRGVWWVLFVPYFLKELYDAYLTWKINKGPLAIERAEVWWDGVADFTFVSLGVAYALLITGGVWHHAVFFVALAAAVLVFGARFIPEKRAFDKSKLPYLFRLGTYHCRNLGADLAGEIDGFFRQRGETRHLLLHGNPGSGRTTLAVGIGCEAAIRHGYVRYLPFPKLIEELGTSGRVSKPSEPWSFDEADILIVDDCPGLAAIAPHAPRLAAKRCVWVVITGTDPAMARQDLEAVAPASRITVIDVDALGYEPLDI